jgi:hypothetical protein
MKLLFIVLFLLVSEAKAQFDGTGYFTKDASLKIGTKYFSNGPIGVSGSKHYLIFNNGNLEYRYMNSLVWSTNIKSKKAIKCMFKTKEGFVLFNKLGKVVWNAVPKLGKEEYYRVFSLNGNLIIKKGTIINIGGPDPFGNYVSTLDSKVIWSAKPQDTSSIILLDKDNYLISATCIFKTPGYGDGKNGDDSYVDAFVDIECYDNLYSAQGGFGDNTEIESNVIREMPIGFSATDVKKIFYDGVKNINIIILGHKGNQNSDRIPARNDKWNLRWELVMQFKKGNIISTGYSEPALEYNFHLEQTLINNPAINGQKKFFTKFLSIRTIDSSN